MSAPRDSAALPVSDPPISAAHWSRLEPLIDAALDLPSPRRRSYYDRIATSNPVLADEVERLIDGGTSDDTLLGRAAAERFAILLDEQDGSDERGEDEATASGVRQLRAGLEAALGAAYELGPELGTGGMSHVFAAEERPSGRMIVVKALAPEHAAGSSVERFAREIRVLTSLHHPNIVPLLTAGTTVRTAAMTAPVPFYTMPKVGDDTLRERVVRDGALPIGSAIGILRDIARALAYAHGRNVVHRDIKPGNVLLAGDRAFVSDFGIAKPIAGAGAVLRDAEVTQTGVGIGTPAYMSPEQAAGDPATDHRTDVYAFGCLAYELFAGTSPFHGRSVHETIAAQFRETPRKLTRLRADTPPRVARLVTQCLEKQPDRRPPNGAALLAVLERVVSL